MSAQPEVDDPETRVENTIIALLNTEPDVAALNPVHWSANVAYEEPILKVKVTGVNLIPGEPVYAWAVEIELRTKPTREDSLGAWITVRRLIEQDGLAALLTDGYTAIESPAEDIRPTAGVAGEQRVRTLRFNLRGYTKTI